MSKDEKQFDKKMESLLATLRPVPRRDPRAAAEGRARFLQQAKEMSAGVASKTEKRRQNRASTSLFKRGRLPVLKTLVAVCLAAAVFFGGGAITVHAAQDSLPDETLYPVKTLSEDVSLALTSSPQKQVDLNLSLADRRLDEMTSLAALGKSTPSGVVDRLQAELDATLQSASALDDPALLPALERIRARAGAQLQAANTLKSDAPTDPNITRACARLQEQVQLAAMGEADPQGFRTQVRQRFQYRGGKATSSPASGTEQPGAGATTLTPRGNGSGPGGGGNQFQKGMATPTPGSGTTQPTALQSTPEETPVPGGNGNGAGQGGYQGTVTSGQQGPGSPGGGSGGGSGSGSGSGSGGGSGGGK